MPNSPARVGFQSDADWLRAWVAERINEHGSVEIPAGTALVLCGSIGYDAFIALDGRIWLNSYGDTPDETDNWRAANRTDELLMLQVAGRRYPELLSLLPARPSSAVNCTTCSGSGRYSLELLCMSCGGLGWVESGA